MRKSKHKPISVVPFRLNNISDFVVDKHPLLHPESSLYDEYWTKQAQSCIEGHWGLDKANGIGGYRWMPGNLYFYKNFGIIKKKGAENTTIEGSPDLRDVEWMIFYGLTTCDGFSGFEGDEDYCSFRPLLSLEKKSELSELDKLFLNMYGDKYKKPNGEYKKYIDARECLYRTHDKPMGRAYFHNTAQNFELLSTRRLGKSYSIGQGVILYDFTFNGSRTLTDYVDKATSSTIVVGAVDYRYTAELFSKVEAGNSNIKKLGSYRLDGQKYNGCFWHPADGINSKQFKEKGGVITNEVVTKSGQDKEGAGSKMVNVSYASNSSAGVGFGARRMIVEECGLVSNFSAVHGENSGTQKHDWKYGYSVYLGTGGDIEKIKEIRDSFYNPSKYDILSYPNVFNPGGNSTALFFPSYYKNSAFFDEQGNLDVERSFLYEMQERDSKRGSSNYQKHTISFPLSPDEMFHQSAGNRFNTEIIEDRITELESGDHRYSVGILEYVDEANKKVVWKEDLDKKLKPFLRRQDEVNAESRKGGIVVYEHPQPYKTDRYSRNPLYIVLYDPVGVDLDENDLGGTSLCSVIVLKLYDFNNSYFMLNVVAEWHGRFKTLDENHKQAFKLADYYGCMLLPETNHEDIIRYARRERRYNDLEDKPEFAANEIALQKRRYIKGFAIPPTPKAKAKLEEFLVELLDSVVYKEESIEGREIKTKEITVLQRIPSLRVLEELRDYNQDDNFDAVSCMFLGALYLRNKNIEPTSEYTEENEDSEMSDFNKTFSVIGQTLSRHPAFNY